MPRASTVRSLCLLLISMALLLTLYVQDQSWQPCHVVSRSRDDERHVTARDVVNVTSSRRAPAPVGDESSVSAAGASWDYNWDSYVCVRSLTLSPKMTIDTVAENQRLF